MEEPNIDEEKARQELERKKAWDKARKPSVGGFVLTILFYGGIAFVILLILFGLSEIGSPPLDIDTLPPD